MKLESRIFCVFFYAHDGNSSKYSPCIMNSLVEYDSASPKEKMLMDLFSSINCYGKDGLGVPADMVFEWSVRTVKGLESRFAVNYDFTLAQRSIRTHNMIIDLKENYLDIHGLSHLNHDGSHSTQLIKDAEVEDIRCV